MGREDKSERQAMLRASGENELRRLQHGWPSDTRPARVPRTMQQAFGPHVDRRLYPMPTRRRGNGRIRSVLLACALGVGFAAVLFLNL